MKNKLFFIALMVLVLGGGVFWWLVRTYTGQQSVENSVQNDVAKSNSSFRVVPYNTSQLVKAHSPVMGAFNAKVTVVEFLDPECEACKAMFPIVKKIMEEHKSEVKLVVRYMAFHQNSRYVINILEGIRNQNKYWEAMQLLFEKQEVWADHQNPKPELIPEILKPLNLNLDKVISDAKAGKYDKQIDEDMKDGEMVGVRGTPTFYINGKQISRLGYEGLKEALVLALE